MPDVVERTIPAGTQPKPPRRRMRTLVGAGLLLGLVGAVALWSWPRGNTPGPVPAPPPKVTVSVPLQQTVAATAGFLGQFSAVDAVELRAQVGGMLTDIAFRDGQVVQKGDLLFVIDPRPFQVKLDGAVAQLQTAQARKALADVELWRAQQLRQTSFGTAQTVDQRAADQRSAEAAIDAAQAAIRDARLDLEYARVTAPFTGRIGAHLVSVGSIVSGNRGATTATTLLATVVSLDPIHLDFDMSEADYLAFQDGHRGAAPEADAVIRLAGDARPERHGTLDFLDNVVDRSSGTIHARATVPNPDLSITPGQFARVRVPTARPAPVLLVPAAAIVPDQARQVVMTVAADGTVTPKQVETGGLFHGLRVIRGGLEPTDRVIIGGLVRARPGATVEPVPGTITPDPAGENG